jgi:hypothetical protein
MSQLRRLSSLSEPQIILHVFLSKEQQRLRKFKNRGTEEFALLTINSRRECNAHRGDEMHTQLWLGNLEEETTWET